MFKKLYERLFLETLPNDACPSDPIPFPQEERVLDHRMFNDIYFDDET